MSADHDILATLAPVRDGAPDGDSLLRRLAHPFAVHATHYDATRALWGAAMARRAADPTVAPEGAWARLVAWAVARLTARVEVAEAPRQEHLLICLEPTCGALYLPTPGALREVQLCAVHWRQAEGQGPPKPHRFAQATESAEEEPQVTTPKRAARIRLVAGKGKP